MMDSDAKALPPCEFSAHCLRLLDDLDVPGDERALRRVLLTDARDMQDEYLIDKLRAHVPGCPVCSVKVAEARSLRLQQRMALRRYLVDAEAQVPSSIERILSMARQTSPEEMELPSTSHKRRSYMLPEVFVPLMQHHGNGSAGGNRHFNQTTDDQPPSKNHTSQWLRNGFALATAAALIFAALGVFNHFVFHSSGTTALQSEGKNWSSVIIGVSLLSSLPTISKLYNVDTTSGEREQMPVTDQSAREVQYEKVSPDGKDVLYHFSTQGQVVYTTLGLEQRGDYVTRVPAGGVNNAIWMDNGHILVALVQRGVEEFDMRTGGEVKQFASLTNVYLLFYHAPYLYFQNARQTVIYRSNLATGEKEQLIANRGGPNLTHCVLSPSGNGIYCEGQSDRVSRFGNPLYMVSGDGSGVQALSRSGILLGFAPDHALLYLQVVFNNYQVVRLGQTPEKDLVVMKNAAPASALVGAGDVLLAPDGHGLVVQDGNRANSPRGVWYDDLTTRTSRELFTYLPDSGEQLIGWDQMRVTRTTATADVNTAALQFAA